MYFLQLALFALPVLATTGSRNTPKKHHSQKQSYAYKGPGQYYIENQATGTTMDLYLGDAGPDTAITAYEPTKDNAHQIWQVVAAAQYHQVLIINSATGAIASCPSETNDDGLYQMKGGEVAIDGYSLFTLSINKDKSVQFKNVQDPNLCIDLQGPSDEDGTPIICYSCHPGEGKNQNWIMVPVPKVGDGDGELKL
ncbi:uncharacterized protein LY89DRAFT_275867 [Mollisia scopiformis]|uniref:Ricin B lectin domain-containing protein n=1 Tax=Mollisia scopiformis TaxID=149040 RepID=A0A132BBE3_MOLSC|nr:uncharacterized protein LY89DRAFT_275867 [Mollisia scopiformis]KUJ09698.1 hypothetical protein LY89DRAFT_275867 [Mollisia scopiformis]